MFRDYDGKVEWVPLILAGLVGTFFCAVLVGVGLGVFGEIQNLRAFDAITACEAKQGVARRKPLTTRITCVPAIQRQDTTTVRISK